MKDKCFNVITMRGQALSVWRGQIPDETITKCKMGNVLRGRRWRGGGEGRERNNGKKKRKRQN